MKSSFGICLYEPKFESNLGCLVRSAYCFGAAFICTVGNRYKRCVTDTPDVANNIPVFHYETFRDFQRLRPQDYILTAVEVWGSKILQSYAHHKKEIYVFGGEDRTLPEDIMDFCKSSVRVDSNCCLNLACIGSIIMYDRTLKIK